MHGSIHGIQQGDLLEALEALCADAGLEAGWARAIGEVRDVVLGRGGKPFAEVSDARLISLDASVAMLGSRPSLRATAVILADFGGVPTTLSGELIAAECVSVEAAITGASGRAQRVVGSRGTPTLHVLEDADGTAAAPASVKNPPEPRREKPAPAPRRAEPAPEPRRERSAPEPRRERSAPEPRREEPGPEERAEKPARRAAEAIPRRPEVLGGRSASAAPAGGSASDWSAVAAVSERVSAGADDESEVDVDELDRGDVIEHPSLANCTVVNVVNDDAIKVRLPNGSVRKLVMRGFRIFRTETPKTFRIERKR